MLLPFLLLLLAVCTGRGAAIRTHRAPNGTCTTRLKRRAWHTFSPREKRAYIEADLCLTRLPAKLGLPGARNRFEELQSIHQRQAAITHGVGAFLPYHRLQVYAHEHLIREECGYRGAQPYWDEARDAGRFLKSVVLDPVTGFGGNGVGEKGCIVDGPFANYTNNLGPGYKIGEHCIYRFVNDTLSVMAGRQYIDFCYNKTTFDKFWPCVEQAPHNGGHAAVGGKMIDPIASPGDPIFYLHHTWLDKVFWEWQAQNLSARLTDIGGKNRQVNVPANGTDGQPPFVLTVPDEQDFKNGPPLILPNMLAFPPPDAMVPLAGSPPQIPDGDPANVTTLSHVLDMYGVIANATIADVMDIRGPLLCYEYV